MAHSPSPPKLRLIQGGLARAEQLGQARLQILPLEQALPPVQAVVEEQDSHRLLDTATTLTDTPEDITQLVAAMAATPTVAPGSVQLIKGSPLRLRTIVYDIEHEPICDPAWLERSYTKLFQLIQRYRLSAVALPLLGIAHGPLKPATSLKLLMASLAGQAFNPPLHLWLRLPSAMVAETLMLLHTAD